MMGIDNPSTVVIGLLFIVALFLFIRNSKNNDFIKELKEINVGHQKSYNKLLHQKKSSEVRLGKIGENLAPFTEHWPWDANDFRFLGSPIDGIQFTEDCIYIVEIKTGKSRLSILQKRCKQLVKEGKVKFVTFRIGENNATLKID